MVLFFYVVLNAIAVFLFLMKKQSLHILETIVYWTISSYIYQNFSALCYMNFKTLIVSDRLSYAIAHVLNRLVLFPLLMVTFLDFFQSLTTHFTRRLLLIVSFTCLLAGLEWLADYLGVLIHVHWRLWWTFSFWLISLLVLIGFMKIFQRILYKGELN